MKFCRVHFKARKTNCAEDKVYWSSVCDDISSSPSQAFVSSLLLIFQANVKATDWIIDLHRSFVDLLDRDEPYKLAPKRMHCLFTSCRQSAWTGFSVRIYDIVHICCWQSLFSLSLPRSDRRIGDLFYYKWIAISTALPLFTLSDVSCLL
jgi:hypothetical protein